MQKSEQKLSRFIRKQLKNVPTHLQQQILTSREPKLKIQYDRQNKSQRNISIISPLVVPKLTQYEKKLRDAIQYRFRKSSINNFVYKLQQTQSFPINMKQNQKNLNDQSSLQSSQIAELKDFKYLKENKFVNIHQYNIHKKQILQKKLEKQITSYKINRHLESSYNIHRRFNTETQIPDKRNNQGSKIRRRIKIKKQDQIQKSLKYQLKDTFKLTKHKNLLKSQSKHQALQNSRYQQKIYQLQNKYQKKHGNQQQAAEQRQSARMIRKKEQNYRLLSVRHLQNINQSLTQPNIDNDSQNFIRQDKKRQKLYSPQNRSISNNLINKLNRQSNMPSSLSQKKWKLQEINLKFKPLNRQKPDQDNQFQQFKCQFQIQTEKSTNNMISNLNLRKQQILNNRKTIYHRNMRQKQTKHTQIQQTNKYNFRRQLKIRIQIPQNQKSRQKTPNYHQTIVNDSPYDSQINKGIKKSTSKRRNPVFLKTYQKRKTQRFSTII